MITMNDILHRMPKGYNIVVYNTISGRFIDDFIWDGKFTGCKLDIRFTHNTNVDKIDILELNHHSIIRLYIFDYAYPTDFLEYCCKVKFESKEDKKVTLAIVTRDGNIDTYEAKITMTNSEYSKYIENFGHICEDKYKNLRLRNEQNNIISNFNTFESKDGSLIVTAFL